MLSEYAFIKNWRVHIDAIQNGLREGRRSSRIGGMPILVHKQGERRHIAVRLDVQWVDGKKGVADLKLFPRHYPKRPFKIEETDGGEKIREDDLILEDGARTIHLDGVAMLVKGEGHQVETTISGRNGFESKITLRLDTAALGPVLSVSTLANGAEQNMTADEVVRESAAFSGASGRPIAVAASASAPFLELYFDNAQPGRDAVWRAALLVTDRFKLSSDTEEKVTHVTHAPFTVAQVVAPQFDPEAGTILAQWNSDDSERAQWRFAVDTVQLCLPAQSVGESMVRGRRFTDDSLDDNGLDPDRPVNSRFSRATDISVRPSRIIRRYTVHPGDILAVLRDAQLQRLVSEMAYPLEFTYQRTPQSKRDVVVSELGQWLGEPASSLPQHDPLLKRALAESMSGTLAQWYLEGWRTADVLPDLERIYSMQRARHLANRASFHHRLAQFRLLDPLHPERKLDLDEGVSARLRGKREGAAPVYPLPLGIELSEQAAAALQDFVAEPAEVDKARAMPIGLVNMIEFSSELLGVLAAPESREVRLTDLTLSVLGATGAMKAAFDEGRTVFEVESANGQLTRAIKTRVGRIAVAWNRAIHVVVYERSTAPGVQFAGEQPLMLGRPLMRKMHEYIEILEPQRLFGSEVTSLENRTGCLHSFAFASKRIYVNGAWGRDLNEEGYEIPLFNLSDQSGFYSKPWLGPVAESGSNDQVSHWHDHPQDMVFYTSTIRGAGADTDTWPAVAGVDDDLHPSFSNIATTERAPASANLAFKTMPSYHLAAGDNPRFAMRVHPDGPSNITHGRGTDKLVAPLRTIHIERTAARSRIGFDKSDPLAVLVANTKNATPLWESVKASAEVKTIEATIAQIERDVGALLDSFGSLEDLALSCDVVKARLLQKVGESFDEAYARIDRPLNQALGAIDLPAVAELVAHQKEQISKALKGTLGVPVPLLRAACAHAERAIEYMRARIGQLEDTVTQPGSASAKVLALLESDNIGIGLRTILERAADTLNGPADFAAQAKGALGLVREELQDNWTRLSSDTDAFFATLQAIRDGDPARLHADTLSWLDDAGVPIGKLLEQFDKVLAVLRGAPLPQSLPALRNAQESCVRTLLRGRAQLAAQREGFHAVKKAIAAFDAGAHDLIRKALDSDVLAPYAAWKAAVAAMVDAAAATVGELEKGFKLAGETIKSHQDIIKSCNFAIRVDAALTAIRTIVAAGAGSLVEAKAELDAALLELRAMVTSTGQNLEAEIIRTHRAAVQAAEAPLQGIVDGMQEGLEDLQAALVALLTDSAATLRTALAERRTDIEDRITALDCTDWDRFRSELKEKVDDLVAQARDQVVEAAAGLLDDDTRRRMTALKEEIVQEAAKLTGDLQKAYDAVAPRAGQAIKLVKLLTEPCELPHITINTSRLECVFDDVKTQIETSPFVARLREAEAGLAELGIANPCRALGAGMITDNIDGAKFNQIFKDLALKFEAFFKSFRLKSFPTDAIKFSHHIDEKKRRAEAKAEIHHQFTSTEQLFDIGAFSLDIRKPVIEATSDFKIAENEAGKARTSASFGGDWLLNFGGQSLVEFHDARIQYSDTAGFKFELDARKVKLAKPLEFIANVFKAMMPELPESVKVIKDKKGMPIGARIEQNNAIGPFNLGPLYIGETVLGSGFGLLVEQGSIKIDTCFNVGDTASPVFMQIGVYGGGGWLKARAFADVVNGKLELGYAASVGVSLGSARAFTLASVASGTYAMRLFVEASFDSKGGNSFIAGLSVNGSARILGYLNAYLLLLLQVEHKGDGMTGTGRLDVEIEVCWCYSVRVSRTVQQKM